MMKFVAFAALFELASSAVVYCGEKATHATITEHKGRLFMEDPERQVAQMVEGDGWVVEALREGRFIDTTQHSEAGKFTFLGSEQIYESELVAKFCHDEFDTAANSALTNSTSFTETGRTAMIPMPKFFRIDLAAGEEVETLEIPTKPANETEFESFNFTNSTLNNTVASAAF